MYLINKMKEVGRLFSLVILIFIISSFTFFIEPPPGLHVIQVKSQRSLKTFFKYTSDRIPFISSHRGGPGKGMPENCLATFENTLKQTWSIIELDPHYTKDSALVLMHDATLQRTSNGHGKVSNLTLAEIRLLKFKDTEGNITEELIPTLDETIEWAKGKTIIIIDQKDVSAKVRAQKIVEHKAQATAMVMAYNLEDAKTCYAIDPNIMMENTFIHDRKGADEFEKSGVPWQNVVVFVTHTEPAETDIFDYIHSKGAMCIRGSSRTIDKGFYSR